MLIPAPLTNLFIFGNLKMMLIAEQLGPQFTPTGHSSTTSLQNFVRRPINQGNQAPLAAPGGPHPEMRICRVGRSARMI